MNLSVDIQTFNHNQCCERDRYDIRERVTEEDYCKKNDCAALKSIIKNESSLT